jgi:hypothetical protein
MHYMPTYVYCDRNGSGPSNWHSVICFRILGDIPNTYAYTKALSESLVAEQMDKLPVVILRPSIGESPFCPPVKLKHELIYHVSFAGSHKKSAYCESHICFLHLDVSIEKQ